MRDLITLVTIYVVLAFCAWIRVDGSRPLVCPRGHTDLYYLNKWKCRVCESRKYNRKRRR